MTAAFDFWINVTQTLLILQAVILLWMTDLARRGL